MVFICLSVAVVFLGLASLVVETDGLSVVSHDLHVIPQNNAMVMEKLEKLAQDNYQHWIALDGVDYHRCKLFGTVITMRYETPKELTWVAEYSLDKDDTLIQESKTVWAKQITVTIPDDPNSDLVDVSYYVLVYLDREATWPFVMSLSLDDVNDLLALLGMDLITHRSDTSLIS